MRCLLLVALMAGVAFAGCSGDASPPAVEDEADGGPRRSVGGSGNGTDAPHDDVVLLEGALQLVGPSEASFQAMVPANVTNVDAIISSPGMVYQEFELAMSLDGCGGFTSPASSRGSFGGPMTSKHRVCVLATPGQHTFTISGGAGTYLEGSIRLVGQVPKAVPDNATAPQG
jgi:hypothetical protein